MKWLCGVVISLASLASLTSLTACAQTSTMDDSSAFEELADGSCTSAQSRSVEAHISRQIAALSKQDWESAYSYASLGFQELVGLDQFIFVITSQYQMLIDSQGAEFGACTIVNNEINQEVRVTSENQSFELGYSLSYDGKALGIESATTILREAETNI